MTAHAHSVAAILTDEQRHIAEAGPEARILVTAGPGTGKTHVLIARLDLLVERHELQPGGEILVLSFSRAAVREIRTRLATGDKDARYIWASTFDSFATRLLTETEIDDAWTRLSYEARIRRAAAAIRLNIEARQVLASLRHICVDEVQDLVGDRADFVRAILEAASPAAGFTLLGDPAQGIYNFQLPKGSEERRVGSASLYAWLRQRFTGSLQECQLTLNQRAHSERARCAGARVGARLSDAAPDYEGVKQDLDRIVRDLPTLGTIEDSVQLLRKPGAPTAILTRDNGQALRISGVLRQSGVPHRLQHRANERVLPAWVALLLSDLPQQQIGRTAFLRRAAERLPAGEPTPTAAWTSLKRLEGGAGDSLDLIRVAGSITAGRVPDDLTQTPSIDLIVSTVHRAKGLEFERVVVVDPPDRESDEDPSELAEDTRVLYVALTRARRDLLHMLAPAGRGVRTCLRTDRWVWMYWKGRGRLISHCEVVGSDVHGTDPAGSYGPVHYDPQETQAYIKETVRVGDPVTLTAVTSDTDGTTRTYYVIAHDGHPVGITSDEFGRSLYATLKLNREWTVNMPRAIEELYVDAVDTTAGSVEAGLRAGLGPSGVWLRVRVGGLGRLVFPKFQAD